MQFTGQTALRLFHPEAVCAEMKSEAEGRHNPAHTPAAVGNKKKSPRQDVKQRQHTSATRIRTHTVQLGPPAAVHSSWHGCSDSGSAA